MAKRMILKQLYDPSKAGQACTVDLVLVHGLNGDPIQTWSSQEGVSGWPQRLLPETQPQTRVLSFGYNADIYRSNSAAGIRDNARALLSQLRALRYGPQATKRPIVFLAHCLGGLIVKQAMAFANSEPEHKEVGSATKTIIFLGTPHFGGDKDRWKFLAGRLGRFAGIYKGKVSPLVNAITDGAPEISEIEEDFRHHARKYTISNNYETDPCKGAGGLVVDKMSAMMGIENNLEAVGGDHRTICHFGDVEDPDFKRFCQLIEEASGEALAPIRRQPRTETPAEDLDEGVARQDDSPAVPPTDVKATARPPATSGASGEALRLDDRPAVPPTDVKATARLAATPGAPKATTTITATVTIVEHFQTTVEGESVIPEHPAPAKTGAEREGQKEQGQPTAAKPKGFRGLFQRRRFRRTSVSPETR
ncbi:hypothetical protein RB595_010228 [Gaeumannomyces hyphopodioides]